MLLLYFVVLCLAVNKNFSLNSEEEICKGICNKETGSMSPFVVNNVEKLLSRYLQENDSKEACIKACVEIVNANKEPMSIMLSKIRSARSPQGEYTVHTSYSENSGSYSNSINDETTSTFVRNADGSAINNVNQVISENNAQSQKSTVGNRSSLYGDKGLLYSDGSSKSSGQSSGSFNNDNIVRTFNYPAGVNVPQIQEATAGLPAGLNMSPGSSSTSPNGFVNSGDGNQAANQNLALRNAALLTRPTTTTTTTTPTTTTTTTTPTTTTTTTTPTTTTTTTTTTRTTTTTTTTRRTTTTTRKPTTRSRGYTQYRGCTDYLDCFLDWVLYD